MCQSLTEIKSKFEDLPEFEGLFNITTQWENVNVNTQKHPTQKSKEWKKTPSFGTPNRFDRFAYHEKRDCANFGHDQKV